MTGATVLVGTYPFGESDAEPRLVLERAGLEILASSEKRKLTGQELRSLVGHADAWIAGTEQVTRELLALAPRLKIVARVGSGLDSVDLEAAREHGVIVSSTPEAPVTSVAELTIGLLLNLARQVTRADRALRAGRWERRTGFLLEGKTLAVLGCGRIGKRVSGLARALGMRVLAHDIVRDDAWARVHDVTYVDRDEVFARADALTVHLPLTPVTRGMLDARALAAMKRGALLVNTSRGEVLDEAALDHALTEGHLGGAALDVFHEEPYRGPLTGHENVVLTAHMGSCSREGRRAMELGAALAVLAYFEGRPVPDRVC